MSLAEHLKNLGLRKESIGSGEDCGEQSTLLKFLKSGLYQIKADRWEEIVGLLPLRTIQFSN